MCFFKIPSAPDIPPTPPPPEVAKRKSGGSFDARMNAAMLAGGTIKTGPLGLSSSSVTAPLAGVKFGG